MEFLVLGGRVQKTAMIPKQRGRTHRPTMRKSKTFYENSVRPFFETDRLSKSEGAMLTGGACEKTYQWAPKKG
ncbi:MAG: putative metal-dependent hydrolase, TIM-barrel fold [Herminiimonas sp.]|nr:putative metal-dependent hydrolase, TIM-barrel fold [Herminiimonas sp.]